MALEQEIQTYQANLPGLLQNEGKYVLIQGKEITDVYDTYEDAIKAGYEKYRLLPFLVRKIQADEQVQNFSRDLNPCPT